jgi:ATP synthase F1 gamma subunit
MALKALSLKIISVTNIQKITSSMKMVAAAKMTGTEKRLKDGRPFGMRTSAAAFPQATDVEADDYDPSYMFTPETGNKHHTVLITSDRGLCGGVNSIVTKAARMAYDKVDDSKSMVFSVVGDKGRGQLGRYFPEQLHYTMDETWKNPPNFDQACAITDRVLAVESDQVNIIFNKFVNQISYDTTWLNCANFAQTAALAEGGDDEGIPDYLADYELEPENKVEALQNLFEFSLASTVYWSMSEGGASEESSRMSAMENASKNAGEIIDGLTLKYNRARQAAITTELIEIISGAAALEG